MIRPSSVECFPRGGLLGWSASKTVARSNRLAGTLLLEIVPSDPPGSRPPVLVFHESTMDGPAGRFSAGPRCDSVVRGRGPHKRYAVAAWQPRSLRRFFC